MNLGVIRKSDSVCVKFPRLGVLRNVAFERTEHFSVKSFYLPIASGIIGFCKQYLHVHKSADILIELGCELRFVIGD